jgi:hypothetical protein
VWSPSCVGFDPVYFLPFAQPQQKYSYAASIAVKEIPEEVKEEFTRRIEDFSGYSLRENSGKKIVEDLTGKQAQVHIDPSLLLDSTSWDKLALDEIPEKDYILLFTILKPVNLIDYALELSKKTGKKVYYLNNKLPYLKKGIKYLPAVSPEKFIALIRNADYVCTNSFHGTAFSVLYHKNFVVETDMEFRKNIRSRELLESLGLPERILEHGRTPDINSEVDWNAVDSRLAVEREKSLEYLKSVQ